MVRCRAGPRSPRSARALLALALSACATHLAARRTDEGALSQDAVLGEATGSSGRCAERDVVQWAGSAFHAAVSAVGCCLGGDAVPDDVLHALRRNESLPCDVPLRFQRMDAPATSLLESSGRSGVWPRGASDACPICLDRLERTWRAVCGHRFCHDCLERWGNISSSCPMCRRPLGTHVPCRIRRRRRLRRLLRLLQDASSLAAGAAFGVAAHAKVRLYVWSLGYDAYLGSAHAVAVMAVVGIVGRVLCDLRQP